MLWSYIATAIEALQFELVVIENVGTGCSRRVVVRPTLKVQLRTTRNPDDATGEPQPGSSQLRV